MLPCFCRLVFQTGRVRFDRFEKTVYEVVHHHLPKSVEIGLSTDPIEVIREFVDVPIDVSDHGSSCHVPRGEDKVEESHLKNVLSIASKAATMDLPSSFINVVWQCLSNFWCPQRFAKSRSGLM